MQFIFARIVRDVRRCRPAHATLGPPSASARMIFFISKKATVRPVVEYASPCWQTSLTTEQTKQREDIQRRALQVIFRNISYDEARRACNIPSL